MIKGVFGIRKLFRWFKCIVLDNHEYVRVPYPLTRSELDFFPLMIWKCRYCGRTICDYI